jgi:hydrogenase maturation protein HypF
MDSLAEREDETKKIAVEFLLSGVVQGVGFRPYVYNLARKLGLGGYVHNGSRALNIVVEGSRKKVEEFEEEIINHPPALAQIEKLEKKEIPFHNYPEFEIRLSLAEEETRVMVPPDVATCQDCRRDIFNPDDRHYHYPFTNCTNCGPRFTITYSLPYDRAHTTMADFSMCDDCAQEYRNPADRRFHAQPVACPRCGPQICLINDKGELITEKDWLAKTKELLYKGDILALKSLGGFHLACLVREDVIAKLRMRKNRPTKPLAVMAKDLETAAKYCEINKEEEQILLAPAAPIVVLKLKENSLLPPNLNPGLNTLGVMLPYTPLHLLLFEDFDFLVMTSGNRTNLPLAKNNQEALTDLKDVADYFLLHNREIVNRCDDSVVAVIDKQMQFWRRSRGYVPSRIEVIAKEKTPVTLAFGGDQKNSFCFLNGNKAYLSQYIGDMETLETQQAFQESIEHWQELLKLKPRIFAADLHPYYESRRLAEEVADEDISYIQHHHAHFASCLAENKCEEPAIGIILDGSGAGLDGKSWGFEIICGDFLGFKRLFHLAYVPLPGNEEAIRHPWRIALAYLIHFLKEEGECFAREKFNREEGFEVVLNQFKRRFNAPEACGCGRLFDGVSALLGLVCHATYEAEAASVLGEQVNFIDNISDLNEVYQFAFKDEIIDPTLILKGVVCDLKTFVPKERIALKFHQTLTDIILKAAKKAYRQTGIRTVVLSGGVWQNRWLFSRTKKGLLAEGFRVLTHHQIPTNDGGIALGQAMIAARRYEKKCV